MAGSKREKAWQQQRSVIMAKHGIVSSIALRGLLRRGDSGIAHIENNIEKHGVSINGVMAAAACSETGGMWYQQA